MKPRCTSCKHNHCDPGGLGCAWCRCGHPSGCRCGGCVDERAAKRCECGTVMHGCRACGFPFVCDHCNVLGGGCLCPRTGLQLFLAGEDVDFDVLAGELHLEEVDFDVLWFDRDHLTPANS